MTAEKNELEEMQSAVSNKRNAKSLTPTKNAKPSSKPSGSKSFLSWGQNKKEEQIRDASPEVLSGFSDHVYMQSLMQSPI